MSNINNNLYRFGEFRFDRDLQKLWQNDEQVLLSPKATELLNLLLDQNGKFISKEEIFDTVWKDTFVEDGVLTQNIYTLRRALGNDQNDHPLIENKTRLGYRITIPIIAESKSSIESKEVSSIETEENLTQEFPAVPRRRIAKLAFILLGILIFAGVAVAFYFRPIVSAFFRKPIESVKFTQVTNTGDLSRAALSNDGNSLAFVRADKIFLKDLASSREIPLDIPNVSSFNTLQFSSDGNYLYFRDSKSPYISAKIRKTSRLGGDSQVVIENSFGPFSISPDNKFAAYYFRPFPDPNPKLMVRNLETKKEREIFQADGALNICETCMPAWSPDGKTIIHVSQNWGNQPSKLNLIDIESGKNQPLEFPRLRRFEQASWSPDGNSFVVSASEDGKNFHLWKVYYPAGDIQRMTNGLNSYQNTVISADGKKILTVQTSENANIFLANSANLNEQKPLTNGNSNAFGQTSLAWIDEQNVVFSSQNGNDLVENFWAIDYEGKHKRQLTNETASSPWTPNSDGKSIYFSIIRNGYVGISKIGTNGENLTELTKSNDGGRRSPQISPDGNFLYYLFRNKEGGKVMRRDLRTQTEEVFFENENVSCGFFLALSNDGKYLACPNWKFYSRVHPDNFTSEIAVFSTVNKEELRFIPIANIQPNFRFSPDSKGIEFISSIDDGSKLLRQGFDQTEPKPILNLQNERVFNFDWSRSGKQLAISKGRQIRDALLLTEFDK